MWESFVQFMGQAGEWFDNFSAWWNTLDWEQIKEAFTIGLGSISAILTVICFLLKMSGNSKVKSTAEKITSFNSIVQQAVADAESLGNYSGEEKKAYALAKIKAICTEKKLDFTEEEISAAIEAVIALSKTVNFKAGNK